MAIRVGGDRSAYDRFEPLLKAMGDRRVHVGAIGSGLVTKLEHNCASQASQTAIAEVFVLRTIHKNMTLATGLCRRLGVPMRFANMALADIQEAMQRGWFERDCRAVRMLPQERVGVSIQVPVDRIHAAMRDDPPAPTDSKYGEGT